MSKYLPSLSRRFQLFCLLLAMCALTSVARADDVPTFSDPDVTTFVKSYGEFTDQYVVIMKDYMAATKTGDSAKMQAAAAKVSGLQTKSTDLQTQSAKLSTKLKPEETQKFTAFLQACAQKMTDAMKQ